MVYRGWKSQHRENGEIGAQYSAGSEWIGSCRGAATDEKQGLEEPCHVEVMVAW